MSDDVTRLYRYVDDENEPYYMDVDRKETSYELPDCRYVVFDPDTREIVFTSWDHSKPKEVMQLDVVEVPTISADLTVPYLPDHRLPFNKEEFTVLMDSGIGLLEFSPKPLNGPVLKCCIHKKEAVSLSKLVIQHGTSGGWEHLLRVCLLVQSFPDLVDEAYFQVIRQTMGWDRQWRETRKANWVLLVALTTFFPSTRTVERQIRGYFCSCFEDSCLEVSDLSALAYIRYDCRMASQKASSVNEEELRMLSENALVSHRKFGASIYEQLWSQRRQQRRLPIPFVEHHMAELLLRSGCERQEGLFRLPGNLKRVDDMALRANMNEDAIAGASINDLASLFKKWFRDLDVPLLDCESCENLRRLPSGGDGSVDIANSLSSGHRHSLMYLVGFLQRLCKSEVSAVTLMTARNLAIVFGPNLVRPLEDAPHTLQVYSQLAVLFLETLIGCWNTLEIYPLPRHLLD